MDRLISLLAALVGLIALGGAVIVHNNANAVMQRQAAEIAQLRTALDAASGQAEPVDTGFAEALLALQRRIVSLEDSARDDAEHVAAAVEDADAPAASAAQTAAYSESGPTSDCIPLGTRFMAQAGDGFPICSTNVVVNVSAVTDGSAIIEGTGPVAAGGFGNLPVQGCTIMVFTADISGFAEMRVSCT